MAIKTTERESGNGKEFILFTFSRNPVMIASYKIDEICDKNEDSFFIYNIYVYIHMDIE